MQLMQNTALAVTLEVSMNDTLIQQADEELMLRYRDGDAAAFEVLYSRHKAALFRYFNRQCSEPAIAEELFQDCWMSIIKSRINYVASAKFTTFIYTIAHHKLVDYYRRNNNHITDSIHKHDATNQDNSGDDSNTSNIELVAPRHEQPEQQVALEQKRLRLVAAIKQLPENQREVFLLREESGFSLDDIADITEVNIETAKSRLRYAVKSLTKLIQAGDS